MDREIYELSREAHRDDCSREAYKMYYQALEAKIAWMEQEAFAASATIERLRSLLHEARGALFCWSPVSEAGKKHKQEVSDAIDAELEEKE